MKFHLWTLCIAFSFIIDAQASSWSYTQILTVHHLGNAKKNDGLRRDSFMLEKQVNATDRLSFGYVENSEDHHGLSIGYAHDFYQQPRFDITGKIQLLSQYKQERNSVMPLPLLGIRYHLTRRLHLNFEGMYIPHNPQAYTLMIVSLNLSQ